MARLIRAHDWTKTPLGDVSTWPDALVQTLNTIMSAPLAIHVFWGEDLLCLYNDAMMEVLGDKHPHALGRPAREVWCEAWHSIAPQLEQAYRHGRAVSMNNVYVPVLVNGSMEDVYWTYSYSPIYDAEGRIAGVLDVAQVTTPSVLSEHAELEVRRGRERLQLALEAANLATWYYDPARNVVGGDERMARLFGLSVLEAPAEFWLNALLKEDHERVAAEFGASVAGAPYHTEYRVCVDDRIRWIRANAILIREHEDAQPRMVGICEDITARKSAESQLHATIERLALAEQVGNIAAWEWDLRTGCFIWDEAGAWVYGRSPEELTTEAALMQHIHPEDGARVMQEIQPALQGTGEFSCEFRVCWPDGTIHWLIGRGKPIFDSDGSVVRINGLNIDITDRRTAEMALRQTEKLAAVGQMASTIAHEINNPLESVTNLLYICKTSTRDEALLHYLSTAEVELRRVSMIANQTLRFHKQLSNATDVRGEEVFESALMIYQGRIQNAHIQVERRLRARRPVRCYEGEIRQVMNNLIGNAIDAMRKSGGRLLVRTAEATDWETGRKGLRLTVADTGTGMDRKVLSQIFQPFYTTKGIGGTGLGLWVSQEIVDRHSGRLTLRSSQRPGRSGTVFALFLPFER